MGMTKNYGLDTGQISWNIPFVMSHQEMNSANFKAKHPGEILQTFLPQIIVAPNRINVPIQPQFIQIRFPDDVPRVKDAAAILKFRNNLTT